MSSLNNNYSKTIHIDDHNQFERNAVSATEDSFMTPQITMPIIMIVGFFNYYLLHPLQRNDTFLGYYMNERD